ETSEALGFGFRCGFLGLLHADIVQARLEREFDLALIATAPAVVYRVKTTDGNQTEVQNPAELPAPDHIEEIAETWVDLSVFLPEEYVGAGMGRLQEKRGEMKDMVYHGRRVELRYAVPFGEILYDFHDRLKSLSRGYASMDYHFSGYGPGDLVKLDVLANEEEGDALPGGRHRAKGEEGGAHG